MPCNCTFSILNWYTQSAKLEVQLKICLVYLIVLKWNYCKYTLNILHLKMILFKDHTILIKSDIKTHFILNIKKMCIVHK